jgi:hypothetical protein
MKELNWEFMKMIIEIILENKEGNIFYHLLMYDKQFIEKIIPDNLDKEYWKNNLKNIRFRVIEE